MTHYIPLLTLAACIAPAFAADGWLTDLDAAKKQAAAENKAILVEFSGSDWCSYSRNLRKKIMLKPEFINYASKKFVLVNIDNPRRTKLPKEQQQKNDAWGEQYNVDGFPTVIVLDADGAAYGGFSGGKPDFNSVKEPIEEALQTLHETKDAITIAGKLTGDDKIKILKQIYQGIPEEYRSSHKTLLNNIVSLDKKDITGLVAKTKKEAILSGIESDLNKSLTATKNPLDILPKIDTYLADAGLPKEARLSLLETKMKIMLGEASTEADIDKALLVIDDITKINPSFAAEAKKLKSSIKEHQDELLEQNQSRKAN